jgi:hypothetical protein
MLYGTRRGHLEDQPKWHLTSDYAPRSMFCRMQP